MIGIFEFFNTISAVCEFERPQVLRLLRMVGLTGRIAATAPIDQRQVSDQTGHALPHQNFNLS